jgi:hypothetical protein
MTRPQPTIRCGRCEARYACPSPSAATKRPRSASRNRLRPLGRRNTVSPASRHARRKLSGRL